ncbi:MAG TPA: TetR/AcrR family transcriptional regulator [Pseudogracilibacillus sp.]|nr:TetR/AcrR family transcriptional regulator [Pseudogracilibacillus sp.]
MCYLTKDKIKERALTLFVEKGYVGTSLADIGNEVGIKKQSIYTHFKSKDDLFLQVMEQVIEEEKQFLNSYFLERRHGQLLDVLHGFIMLFRDRFLEENEENAKFLLRMMFLPPNHLQRTVIKQFLHFYQILEEHVAHLFIENEHHLSVDPYVAKKAFLNIFDGLLVELIYVNVDSFEKRLDASWQVFSKAIKKNVDCQN